MNTNQLIWDFQRTLIEIYKQENLTCLSGIDGKYELNGRNLIMWHADVTRKNALKCNGQFNYHSNLEDILFCSDELLYFTAHLFLYRPYINNPLKDGFEFSHGMIYPDLQNLEGKRYSMYADIASQCLYNYWDHIGDIIASFFHDSIPSNRIFFPSAIEIIPQEFRDSENFRWLKDFKDQEYAAMNSMRKQIVHYTTSNTMFKVEHANVVKDRDAMEKLLYQRNGLADFFRDHINLTMKGFEKVLSLLNEFNTELFTET